MSNAVREKLEAYFASLNSTSNRMMADIVSSREEFKDKWENMPPEEQSEILWKSIVKSNAISKYKNLPVKSLDIEYFPVLRTRPGEKIIVDEDSASAKSFVSGSTWHDEHSAPFRWETQSQIDLRIHDDDDNTEKEQVKTLPRNSVLPTSPKPGREESPKLLSERQESPRHGRQDSPMSERKLSPMPERKLSPMPERKLSPMLERKLSPMSERKLSTMPERKLSTMPEKKLSPMPVRKQSPMPERKGSPLLERQEVKKDDDIKRQTIKRPEVPPPPVPPHAIPPIPPHAESPPVPQHIEKAEKGEMPIYAKVVKRKSSCKTLVISEMKAHRKAKEEMKPAVPPRMSLELKGNMDLSKYTVQTIDIDGIPKTGFDFLDNW